MTSFNKVAQWTLACICCLLMAAGCAPEDNYQGEEDGQSVSASSSDQGAENLSETSPEGCIDLRRPIMERIGNGMAELQPAHAKFRGDILVLPAWGDSRDAWCHRSNFCTLARDKGYRLILPDMGKSIYTSQPYPETRADWLAFPTYTWLRDSLIPELQEKYCMLPEKGNNFVVGMSAGARGAIRLVEDLPELFAAGAALSGDFDPGQMKGDNIYRGFLGNFQDHSERWEVNENLVSGVDRIRVPVFLAHGKEDPLVPYTQTEQFYTALKNANPDLQVRLQLVGGQMDGYDFWNSQIEPILAFFDATQAVPPESP